MSTKKIKRCKSCPYYSSEVGNYDLYRPYFSFQHIQKGYDLEGKNECKVAFFNQIQKLSQITWKEINRAQKHGLGYEKIDTNAIKAPIPDCVKEDTTLIAFRFNGKCPMVGFRDRNIFHILWFDSRFDLYDHGK